MLVVGLAIRALRMLAGRRVRWIAAATVAIGAASAGDAHAVTLPLPNPLSPITSALGGGAGGLAVGAFDAIVGHLFAPIAHFLNVQLLAWLVAIPDFTGGNVRQLETTVCAMAAAALGAVATISVARYWLAGLAGGGHGFEALEGLARTVGAALFLALWPWIFDTAVGVANLFTRTLMGSGSVTDDSARLLAAGLAAAGGLSLTSLGPFVMLAMAVLASVLFLGLLLVKLVLSVSTVMVFVAMPAAAVLWPIPACAWLARLTARAFAVCLLVPACWALCFAATAAVGVDALSGNAAGLPDKLIEPLTAIVLLYVTLSLPRSLARAALLGGSLLGGATVSRAVSYAAGRTAATAVAQHLPVGVGGKRPSAGSPPVSMPGEATRHRAAGGAHAASAQAASAQAATSARSGGDAIARGDSAAAASGQTAGRPAPSAPPSPASPATAGADGLQSPSFHGREHHHALEMLNAETRAASSPVTRAQAADALRTLPADTRHGVAGLVGQHGDGAREHLAYQALGDWSDEQRDALRTLAAATPQVREQAVGDVLGPDAGHAPAGDVDDAPVGRPVFHAGPPTGPSRPPQPAAPASGPLPGEPVGDGSGETG